MEDIRNSDVAPPDGRTADADRIDDDTWTLVHVRSVEHPALEPRLLASGARGESTVQEAAAIMTKFLKTATTIRRQRIGVAVGRWRAMCASAAL